MCIKRAHCKLVRCTKCSTLYNKKFIIIINKSFGPDDVSPVIRKCYSAPLLCSFLIALCQLNRQEQMYAQFIRARMTKTVQANAHQYLNIVREVAERCR